MLWLYILSRESPSDHGPAQQTRDADPTPGRRLVPAWRESERPYTYKASRDINTSRLDADPPSTTMDQHRTSKVYRGLAGFG